MPTTDGLKKIAEWLEAEKAGRAMDQANAAADRIIWGGGQAVPAAAWGQIGGADERPCCAHLTVGYVRQHLGAGKERGWWQCTECEQKFVALGTTPP